MIRKASIVAALVVFSAGASPAPAVDSAVLGRWSCVAQSPEGELPADWVIQEAAGAVLVDVEIGGVSRPAKDVKLEGRTLTMKVTYESVPYDVSVVFDGETLSGTWSGDGRQGAVRGKRV
jgi:hypothetical protein